MPTAGPPSLADVDNPRLVHWFEGRSESGLLIVRDPDGAVVATWRPPDGAEIRHLSEALSPDGRYLTWLSGKRPDDDLVGPIDPPLTLHVQDLLTGEERFSHALLHPGILEDLRQQVLTVEGWGETRGGGGDDGNDWTPSWERPGQWPANFFTGVIQGVFDNGIGRTAWSPDGSRLAIVAALDGPTSDVYLLDRADFTMRQLTREPEHVTQIDWSPDGRHLIFSAGLEPASYNSGYRALYLVDTESGADHRFPTVEPNPRGPSGPMTSMFDNSRSGNIEDGWPDGWTRQGQAIAPPQEAGVGGLSRYDPISGKEIEVVPRIGDLSSSDAYNLYDLTSMP